MLVERAQAISSEIIPATEEDWGTEYLDAIISVKILDSIDEAITHINTYKRGHSESLITNDYDNALRFLDEIDAAAVYVNASTRFTDGFEMCIRDRYLFQPHFQYVFKYSSVCSSVNLYSFRTLLNVSILEAFKF